MATLLEDPSVDEKLKITDSGDHDIFAHYVNKADLERAIFDGVEIKALCGKMWRPDKDYAKYPVCPECKTIWETLP